MLTTATSTRDQITLAIDKTHAHCDELEHLLRRLVDLTWGTADDGSTSTPAQDGTAADLHHRLSQLAAATHAICEQTKDLAQPSTN